VSGPSNYECRFRLTSSQRSVSLDLKCPQQSTTIRLVRTASEGKALPYREHLAANSLFAGVAAALRSDGDFRARAIARGSVFRGLYHRIRFRPRSEGIRNAYCSGNTGNSGPAFVNDRNGSTPDDHLKLVPANHERERRLTSTRRLEKRRPQGGNRDRTAPGKRFHIVSAGDSPFAVTAPSMERSASPANSAGNHGLPLELGGSA